MKKQYLAILLILTLLIISMNGCTFFKRPSGGIWVCEKLQIEFELTGQRSKGTIIIDGEERDIIVFIGAGEGKIVFAENADKMLTEMNPLYAGTFINRGENKMILILGRTNKRYVFVRQK